MIEAPTLAESLDTLKNRFVAKGVAYPTIEELRRIWLNGQARGKIVMVESPQEGDPPETGVAIIVTTDSGHLIRIPISKKKAWNLGTLLRECS